MNCPQCGRTALFVRARPFDDGSGMVYTCENESCSANHLYFYPTQAELPIDDRTSPDGCVLRSFLANQKTWLTRADICKCLGWTERRVREAAEQLGAEIVRCQLGFKLTAQLTRDDLALAQQAVDAFWSQGRRMLRYSLALRKRMHSIVG